MHELRFRSLLSCSSAGRTCPRHTEAGPRDWRGPASRYSTTILPTMPASLCAGWMQTTL